MTRFFSWILTFIRWILAVKDDFLVPGARATHTYVIGQPGTGKSRAIESWVMQDIEAGHGVGVLDPHGDLFRNLLLRLTRKPDLWKRVVVLDPCNPKWTVCFNPLMAVEGLPYERLALFLTDVVIKIWKVDPTSSPRMVWLMTNTFLALIDLGLTLLDLPRFLLNQDFRNNLVPRIRNEAARTYFSFEFPTKLGTIHEWVTPALNKLGGLIFDPDLRLMLAGSSRLDFSAILDNLVLLVNLPKGIIGEESSALMGAFIVAYLQKAALARAGSRWRPPFYLYLDEFQNYTTDNIQDILSESRKYGLSLTLAHQYLDQLSPELRSAVLNTTGTKACFKVGYHDGLVLAPEIFPTPDFASAFAKDAYDFSHVRRGPYRLGKANAESFHWGQLAGELAQLPYRHFWVRQRGAHAPTKQRTLDVPDPKMTLETEAKLRELLDISGQQFGRLKRDIRREIEERHGRLINNASTNVQDSDTPEFWGE